MNISGTDDYAIADPFALPPAIGAVMLVLLGYDEQSPDTCLGPETRDVTS